MSRIDFTEVRRLCASGVTQVEVGRKFGISRSYVSDIVTGRAGWAEDGADQVQAAKDARTASRSRLTRSLRAEDLFSEAAEVAKQYIKPLPKVKPPRFTKRVGAVEETAVLVLSDGHHDQVVRADSVGGLEEHNFPIALRRMETLCDSVSKFCTRTLTGYNFDRLVVLNLGDSTSGEIHDAEKRSAFGSMFRNSLAIGALHASLYRDLSAHFPAVDVYNVSGNHGRRTPHGKEYSGPTNNWDWHIARIAEAYCTNTESIRFHSPDSFSTIVPIRGFGVHMSHGDDLSAPAGNPAAGLRKRFERQSAIHSGANSVQSLRRGERIDVAVCGHFHTLTMCRGNGVTYISNGAFVATDEYAYNKLGVCNPPEQMLFGMHDRHCVTWSLPIQLTGRDRNVECRYDHIMDLVS